jgi:uncharacterized membrane protein YgaE (UPF0421/DUF939 family)
MKSLPALCLGALGGVATFVLPHLSGWGFIVGIVVTISLAYGIGIWRGATDET